MSHPTFFNSSNTNPTTSNGSITEQQRIFDGFQSLIAISKNVSENGQTLSTLRNDGTGTTDNDTDIEQLSMENMLTGQLLLHKAFELYEGLVPHNDPSIVSYYNFFGDQLLSQEHYWDALHCFLKSLDIIFTALSDKHPLLTETFSKIAEAHEKIGNYEQATDYAQQAVDTASTTSGSTDAKLKKYENQLLRLYEKK